jgi:hypothetical protein
VARSKIHPDAARLIPERRHRTGLPRRRRNWSREVAPGRGPAQRGHQVIADNVCFLQRDESGKIQACPDITRIRLWEDAMAALGCDAAGAEREMRGYNKCLLPPHHRGIHESRAPLRIELHWRLFLNPHAIAETSIMTASRVLPLARAAGLRTLGEEDLFAYLCMHGALHWWNRLKWLADVNALLASTPEDGLERLVHAAEARGAGRAAAQAMLLCRRLLGLPLPARLIARLSKGAAMRWLEATALNAMVTGQGEHDPHDIRFGTTRGSLSTFLLSPSWRYRLAELNVHLINQTDVLTVPLPEPLRFLYPMLRLPLWAWRHAVRRV